MKIKVVGNKSWETDPLINALLNPKFKPSTLPYPVVINQPRLYSQGAVHIPRLVYQFNGHTVEVWCIEDQMDPAVSGSSSLEKVRILPDIINNYEEPIDLVIAFGTAGHPDAGNNGSVATGSYFVNYNGYDPSNPTPWDGTINGTNYMDTVLHRDIPADLQSLFTNCNFAELEPKFLSVPLKPSKNPHVIIDQNNLAVSDTNIINYNLYKTEDFEAIKEAQRLAPDKTIASAETTHGIIAANTFAYTAAPVVFVSALTDMVGQFDQEVSPKPEAQNYTAAFNGGIYLSYVLANLGSI